MKTESWEYWAELRAMYRVWDHTWAQCRTPEMSQQPPILEGSFVAYQAIARVRPFAKLRAALDACAKEGARRVPPQRLRLLMWVTGAAIAQHTHSPVQAQRLLAEAQELSRHCHQPSTWQPWMGPYPVQKPRIPVSRYLDGEPASDPSGDPELPRDVMQLELPPTDQDWGFTPMWMILEGINHWQAIVEQHIGIGLSRFHTDPQTSLARLFESVNDPELEWQRATQWRETLQWFAA